MPSLRVREWQKDLHNQGHLVDGAAWPLCVQENLCPISGLRLSAGGKPTAEEFDLEAVAVGGGFDQFAVLEVAQCLLQRH